MMFTRSERLFLRPAWPEDWEEILPQIAEEAVVRNLARAPWPYTAQDARAFAAQPQDSRLPNFMITLPREAGAVIGSVGLAPGQPGDADPNLGYWIGREHWGKGYATEATRALLDVARMLGHRRVMAAHFVDNPTSGTVLRKAGFRPTGQIRAISSRSRGCAVASVTHAIDLADAADPDNRGYEERRAA